MPVTDRRIAPVTPALLEEWRETDRREINAWRRVAAMCNNGEVPTFPVGVDDDFVAFEDLLDGLDA